MEKKYFVLFVGHLVLTPGNCEELITNHVALRLLKVVKEAQTKAETEL
jgi:hypothetical protein